MGGATARYCACRILLRDREGRWKKKRMAVEVNLCLPIFFHSSIHTATYSYKDLHEYPPRDTSHVTWRSSTLSSKLLTTSPSHFPPPPPDTDHWSQVFIVAMAGDCREVVFAQTQQIVPPRSRDLRSAFSRAVEFTAIHEPCAVARRRDSVTAGFLENGMWSRCMDE